jgi:hypothetical protein
MSVKVMDWVFHCSRSEGIARLVLLAIADSSNDQGDQAWPSMSTLAAKCGVDRSTVVRSLARLEELGELRRTPYGGRHRSNCYRIVMADDEEQQVQSAPIDRCTEQQVQSAPGAERTYQQVQSAPLIGAERTTNRPYVLEPSIVPNPETEPGVTERPRKAKKPRGTGPPDEFEITPTLRSWASKQNLAGVDLDEQTRQWLDHHRAKGSKFQDWTASWRTWMRNAQRWAPRSQEQAPVENLAAGSRFG